MSKVLGATLVGSLAVETIGAVDEQRRLPSPARYLATLTLWFVLATVAAFGPRASRLADTISAVVLLTMLVVGGTGKLVAGLFDSAARFFPTTPAAAPLPPDTSAKIAGIGEQVTTLFGGIQ